MAHSEVCPVCRGRGIVEAHPEWQTDINASTPKPCHGCGGLGWVSVQDESITKLIHGHIPTATDGQR